MLRFSRSMGEVEMRSIEGEGDREGRKLTGHQPAPPNPPLRAGLSRTHRGPG